VHYAAAHYYDPNKGIQILAFWEFVSGPLHCRTYGPKSSQYFGPSGFIKAPGPTSRTCRPRRIVFGHGKIEGATGQNDGDIATGRFRIVVTTLIEGRIRAFPERTPVRVTKTPKARSWFLVGSRRRADGCFSFSAPVIGSLGLGRKIAKGSCVEFLDLPLRGAVALAALVILGL